eukprot:scaffold746_cov293-Chaetoceros_neogracile.AAC.13
MESFTELAIYFTKINEMISTLSFDVSEAGHYIFFQIAFHSQWVSRSATKLLVCQLFPAHAAFWSGPRCFALTMRLKVKTVAAK